MTISRNQRIEVTGVNEAAKALGCSQGHLWHVLQGRRVSAKLVQRYALLREGKLNTKGQSK